MRERIELLPVAAIVGVVAFAARLLPVVRSHGLLGITEYDDGVHLGSALRLVNGSLPYRDFLFVQPPGISVLLAPFALLAGATDEATMLVTVKLLFMVIGGLNAGLLCHVVRRDRGASAGTVAGVVYAFWTVATSTESTALLEPLLNLALLVALTCLGTSVVSGRRATVAGISLGLGITTKLWLVPVAVVLLVWAARERGREVAVRVGVGVGVAAASIAGAFFVAAPRLMWNEIVLDQLGRGRGPTIASRLSLLTNDTLHIQERLGSNAATTLMAGVIVAAFAGGAVSRAWLWMVLAATELVLVLVAPSYYYHYGDFPALPLSALLGVSAGWALARNARRVRVAAGWAIAGVLLILMGFELSERMPVTAADASVLKAFGRSHDCVWTDSADAALLADREVSRSQGRCHQELDLIGELIDMTRGKGLSDGELDAAIVPQYQSLVRDELGRSDAVVLVRALGDHQWDARTRALFRRRFQPAGSAGAITLWTRREAPTR